MFALFYSQSVYKCFLIHLLQSIFIILYIDKFIWNLVHLACRILFINLFKIIIHYEITVLIQFSMQAIVNFRTRKKKNFANLDDYKYRYSITNYYISILQKFIKENKTNDQLRFVTKKRLLICLWTFLLFFLVFKNYNY